MATKPADGKFSLTYFLFGGGLADWLRPLGDDARRLLIYGIIACILYVGFTHFFPRKPQGNISKPDCDNTVVVTPGATVTGGIHLESRTDTSQKVENKRPWWMPIPFVSVYGEARSKGSDIGSYETGLGGQVGVRLDLN